MKKLNVTSKMMCVDNTNDDTRKYLITASVKFGADGAMNGVDSGFVMTDGGQQIATFRKDGTKGVKVDFVPEALDMQVDALTEIHAFIAAAQEGGEA